MAPAAFLLAVTVAVVLIRAGMNDGPKKPAAVGRTTATTTAHVRKTARRFWVVRAGDTFAVISRRTGVPVAVIARLNPGTSSTSLHIGQKIRIR